MPNMNHIMPSDMSPAAHKFYAKGEKAESRQEEEDDTEGTAEDIKQDTTDGLIADMNADELRALIAAAEAKLDTME